MNYGNSAKSQYVMPLWASAGKDVNPFVLLGSRDFDRHSVLFARLAPLNCEYFLHTPVSIASF